MQHRREQNMKQNFLWIALVLAFLFIGNSVTAQVSKTFKVINKSGFSVTSVRISQSNANEWSMELNTMDKIPNNGSFDFGQKYDTARCMHDIKFTAEDGTEYFLKDINLCRVKEIVLEIREEKQGNMEGPKIETDPNVKTEGKPDEKKPEGKTDEKKPEQKTETKTDAPPPHIDK
jgi:hypothetical protein